MPGISFILNTKDNILQNKSKISQSINSMIHNDQYEHKILIQNKSCFLVSTKYKEYPIASFENDDYSIVLEGRIYNRNNNIETELKNLANKIFSAGSDGKTLAKNWLLKTDGDFVLIIQSKQHNQIYFINDILGRLPIYYFNQNGNFVLTRELQFITDLFDNFKFDRMGLAQYLLFGYPLGKRTLFENIFRLGPATLININLKNSKIKIENIYQFNLEKKKFSKKDYEKNVNKMVKIFCDACKNRTNPNDKNILSLSGGLDSRTVGAGLAKNKVKFYGATYLDYKNIAGDDVKIAEQLAKFFKIDWKLFKLKPPKGKDILELLRIKNGLNFLGMSYILPFYKEMKQNYGHQIINFSGDGGDKTLPNLAPLKNLKNLDELLDYIISSQQIYPLEKTTKLLKIEKQRIISELRDLLMDYPEQDFNQKYVHFMIFERGFKWLFEGEDRNRYYFWSVSPFYSIDFFNYAMNLPDNLKTNYKLYRDFLINLSSETAAIEYSNWKMPISSDKSKLYLLARDFYLKLPSKVTKILKKKYKKVLNLQSSEAPGVKCFWDMIKNCKSISKYFSNSDIKKLSNVSNKEFYNLFTIISEIEKFETGKSTIERYSNSVFP